MSLFYREQLVTNIAEQERLGRLLREDQKAVKDLVQTSAKQLGMWRDVVKYAPGASVHCLVWCRSSLFSFIPTMPSLVQIFFIP